MNSYAYRAIDKRGRAVRVATSALSAQQVMLDARNAGHDIVMLYVLIQERKPHYERVFQCPNFPPPEKLGRRDLQKYRIPNGDIRHAVRKGMVKGRTTLLGTRVDTISLLNYLMNMIQDEIFGKTALILAGVLPSTESRADDPEQYQPFERAIRVDASEEFQPPDQLKILAETAKAYNAVPFEQRDGKLVLLSADPTNLRVADDLNFIFGLDVVLARCHDDRTEHERIVFAILKQSRKAGAILEQVHSTDYLLVAGLIERERGSKSSRTEDWEGTRNGLPQLPVEDANAVLQSRTGEFMQLIGWGQDLDSVPTVKLCKLIATGAAKTGMTGFRIKPSAKHSPVEYFCGNDVFEMDKIARMIHEPIVLILSAAAGILPANLAPAETTFELPAGDTHYQFKAFTELTADGERFEVSWEKAL